MGDKSTRALKKRAEPKGISLKPQSKGARGEIQSSKEGGAELELSAQFSEDWIKKTNMEALKEISRIMVEQMNAQLQMQREREDTEKERSHRREEKNMELIREIIAEQNKVHREDTETLTTQFEKMRMEKEQSRGRKPLKLPPYDGQSMDFNDWQDKTESVLVCNKWDFSTFLELLPTSVSGLAKRAFDSLTEEDKSAKDVFYQKMRVKIDPQSERKNKEMFILARKGPTESIMSFIDRCRQYIRRSGADPNEYFAQEMLRNKVYESLSATDRKILSATISHDEDLDIIVIKADAMASTQPELVGAVREVEKSKSEETPQARKEDMEKKEMGRQHRHNKLSCHGCHLRGHIKRYCPQRLPIEDFQRYFEKQTQNEHIQSYQEAQSRLDQNFEKTLEQGGGNQIKAPGPLPSWNGEPFGDVRNIPIGKEPRPKINEPPMVGEEWDYKGKENQGDQSGTHVRNKQGSGTHVRNTHGTIHPQL